MCTRVLFPPPQDSVPLAFCPKRKGILNTLVDRELTFTGIPAESEKLEGLFGS